MTCSRAGASFETLAPFLYPALLPRQTPRQHGFRSLGHISRRIRSSDGKRWYSPSHASRNQVPLSASSTTSFVPFESPLTTGSVPTPSSSNEHLNPGPGNYNITPFADRCTVTLQSGAGGHGCVSFLREKYIDEGPANGGDGGDGGSVYIQAVRGETSLHRLSRRGHVKAGRGANGKGKGRGGERGQDVLITVPVGTVVREVERVDPRVVERERKREMRAKARRGEVEEDASGVYDHSKWITYPGLTPRQLKYLESPKMPGQRTSMVQAAQPEGPIRLDLDEPMEKPMLLAAGALGGLGNPHFVTKDVHRPTYATRGEDGMSMILNFELKMLADVGLVGLPNAGKSTLLRALSNSRTRIGNWAFTTLQPSIGTVVLDNHKGRPQLTAYEKNGTPRSNFTIADIPGLIEDAHQDKGLGLGFLRHIERAAVLAFVVDLSAGDATAALKSLWREVGEYETIRGKEMNAESESRMAAVERLEGGGSEGLTAASPPITSKPWFVVASKADQPETQGNFAGLQAYIELVKEGKLEHPSGRRNAWRKQPRAIPVSAIRGEGVEMIPKVIIELLG